MRATAMRLIVCGRETNTQQKLYLQRSAEVESRKPCLNILIPQLDTQFYCTAHNSYSFHWIFISLFFFFSFSFLLSAAIDFDSIWTTIYLSLPQIGKITITHSPWRTLKLPITQFIRCCTRKTHFRRRNDDKKNTFLKRKNVKSNESVALKTARLYSMNVPQ